MLEASGYIALLLLAVEVALVFLVALGRTTKAAFATASLFITALTMFFSLGNRVSEITIASVGTIKAAVNVATQYVDDIKKIKLDAETQKQEVGEAVTKLKAEVAQAQAETDQIRLQLADRRLTDEQVTKIADKIHSFADQEYQVTTFWDLKEPLAISNRIDEALALAGWKYIPPGPGGAFLLGGIAGVQVWVHPEADLRVGEAAEALVRALNDEGIAAELRQENPRYPKDNKLHLNVGTKP